LGGVNRSIYFLDKVFQKKNASPDSLDEFPGKGAAFPFISYQSQDANYKGRLLGFNVVYHQIQSEATGRKAVKLQEEGDYVSFTFKQSAKAMVLRYCMPDSADGAGITGSLTIYADGKEIGIISLTSKYEWIYNYAGGWPGSNNPSAGAPCRFFDDSRILFNDTFHLGTEITLIKEDNVEYYIIDMAEFEQVPTPLIQPENSFSITDFGAVSDGGDCRDTLNDCISAAKSQGKEVWIPAGNYEVSGSTNFMSTALPCDLRNNGDDSIAVNSERNQNCTGNTVKNNTIRIPYHASGIAVYGGNNAIQDNIVYDTIAYGGGINISSRFNPTDYHGTTTVKGNVLVRTGSSASASERGKNQGSIWLVAWEKDVSGAVFSGNRLINCVYDGITIDGNGNSIFSGITFQDDVIEQAEGYGISVFNGAVGSASFTGVKINNASDGKLNNPASFTINKGRGNNW
jgi:hypothetical protein